MCSAGHAGRFSDRVAYCRRASSGGLGGIGLKWGWSLFRESGLFSGSGLFVRGFSCNEKDSCPELLRISNYPALLVDQQQRQLKCWLTWHEVARDAAPHPGTLGTDWRQLLAWALCILSVHCKTPNMLCTQQDKALFVFIYRAGGVQQRLLSVCNENCAFICILSKFPFLLMDKIIFCTVTGDSR